ncbi:MAG: DmsE family decaheme c-type cytochrome [Bryobacteraceae bacterium]|jgi:DmsE family decaheme c-type cytochrome
MHRPQVRTAKWPALSVNRRFRALGRAIVAAAVGWVTIASGSARAQADSKPDARPAAPQTPAKLEYMGSETCAACHEDLAKAFQKNPHRLVDTDKKYKHANEACEACHGPASKHEESMNAADIRNPAKLTAAEADRICLSCHLNQPTHAGRINGSHAKNQVSCISCHAIHKNGPNGMVARKPADINRLCANCHQDVWASFQRPYKHRLPEAAMSCVDCHNPHGTILPHSLQLVEANEPACVKCHGDKRGPFTFAHAPVQLEGCTACHEPHGSANPRMLTRAQVYFVCLECHANLAQPTAAANGTIGTVPPAFHDLRNPRFRNCTICHQKIHGSYVSRDFLK